MMENKSQPKLKCGLIGKTLAHSYSPEIHAMLGNYEYQLYELAEDEVEKFLKSGDYSALNVTIPYKKTVMPYLDEISDEARRISSVNTITRAENGRLRGDNTDYYGFSYLLDHAGIDVRGKKVLILGSGGASMTARTVAADRMAGEVVIISRGGSDNYDNIERHADCDVLINTTPVGMYPNAGKSPVSLRRFNKLSGVCDMIYNPAETALTLEAKSLGIRAVTGLTMLVAQAKMASELFTGQKICDSEIERIVSAVSIGKQNLTLVGMPGCGKSTIGKALAELTGRILIDTDELIVSRAKMTIPEIFAAKGELYFRELEHEVLAEVSQKSSLIIATGGGIAVQQRNHPLLRQNSTVVFLNRDIDALPTDGRPISQATDLHELYAVRLPLYRAVSDFEISVGSSGALFNAQKIIAETGLQR